MIHRKQIKIGIDICMSVLLLFLMAFQVTGDKYHEWIGAGMLVLFLLHNALNFGWYKALFKGKYSAVRILRTLINIAVLVAIILTGYSGIVMSRHVFAFLPIESGMALARKLHLAGSYWAFVLMSVHMGIHWSMVSNKLAGSKTSSRTAILWVLRTAALALAVYGAYLFGQAGIYANMFLQNEFAMLDYETPAALVILNNLIMMSSWVYVGHYLMRAVQQIASKKKEKLQGIICLLLAIILILSSAISSPRAESDISWDGAGTGSTEETENDSTQVGTSAPDGFMLIKGGTFEMGSPDTESWRSPDETLHTVTVSDFYMSSYELTQSEYNSTVGENPSNFSGENLPVENITWLDAVNYCNARSSQEGLTPVYQITESGVAWDRSANGYRLPTEAEWEYACRAGTTTPFNTETSISPEESNYYGHYPYDIEENYFEQGNLDTQPGEYRETTVAVDSFSPNAWGLYNMHGNVSEWVWDYYGSYETEAASDPTGPDTGSLKVYRGGGWNDFAKNMRSAYRATLEENLGSFNIGIRLVRNADSTLTDIVGSNAAATQSAEAKSTEAGGQGSGNVLIASFLEGYDFSGKTIIPFCSHGGGRFGQSQTAIAKLAPDAVMGEGLSVHYSGGASLESDVTEWLQTNGIIE